MSINLFIFEMDAEDGSDILGAKKLNYEFLMLVRDKKYPEALAVGKKSTTSTILVLQVQPDNPSVKKFCDFILSHDKERKIIKLGSLENGERRRRVRGGRVR